MTKDERHWQNIGAAKERRAILAHVRRVMRNPTVKRSSRPEFAIEQVAIFIEDRDKRTAKRVGGLGRR